MPADPDLESLATFLKDPASYAHGPERVTLIQTHISIVAVAPPFVYKVKKPVDFGFLDFSTLEKRRFFCEQEVALNRRLCSGVYEGVVPISKRGDGLVLEDDRDVVEYAVKMKQLSDGGFLDQLVDRGAADRSCLDRVVEKLAEFYRARSSTPQMAAWGRVEKLSTSTDENFAQTAALVGDLLSGPAYEAIRYYTGRFYDQHALLLGRRRAEGRILDCHGDLHLEHVHLGPTDVCIYDCIEFNERFRYVDVASDVAFLAMDLEHRQRADLARYLTRRMKQALRDPELPRLMDFYKCYRAYVRGKVEGMRSREQEISAPQRAGSREKAARYFRQALRYAAAGSVPLAVVTMGRVASGKSTLADALGQALGWTVLSSDRIRKERAGVPLFARGDERTRARLYARESTDQTYAALSRGALRHARREGGVVLDATYGSRRHRDALRKALRAAGIRHCFVEADCPDAVARARLRERAGTHDQASDARLEDYEMLNARYERPDDLEDARHFVVGTDRPPEDATLRVLKQLVRLAS